MIERLDLIDSEDPKYNTQICICGDVCHPLIMMQLHLPLLIHFTRATKFNFGKVPVSNFSAFQKFLSTCHHYIYVYIANHLFSSKS